MSINFDNSYAFLNTFKCKNYFFNFDLHDSLYLDVDLQKDHSNLEKIKYMKEDKLLEKILITKKSVFQKVFKLGSFLYNNIDEIKLSENFILYLENDDILIDSDFFNIKKYIIGDKEIQKEIISFWNDFGIPEWYGNAKPVYNPIYIIQNEKTLNTKDKGFMIITYGNKDIEDYWLQYFIIQQEEHYSFNILPYLNLSLLIFCIYNIKDILSNVKTKHLLKSIKLFPYLEKKYYDMCFKDFEINAKDVNDNHLKTNKFFYNKEYIDEVNKYTKLLLLKTIEYTKKNFHILNEEKIIFDDFNLPYEELMKNPYNFSFLKNIYIMSNPVLSAFEYLLKILPNYQSVPPIHFCDNCREVLDYKTLLCLSCKKDIVENAERKYYTSKKDKDIILVKTLKTEYENALEDKYLPTPKIDKIYRDKENSKKYYYSGGNKKKKEKYNMLKNK